MEDFSIYSVSVLMGIAGFILLFAAFLTGKRIIKTPVKYHLHRKFGFWGFILCSVHALVMTYFAFFS